MRYDAVIIGAGLSGLSSAIRLAHFGRRVRIFERHVLPGGLNSWYRRQGMNLDVGLHALTNFQPSTNRNAPLNKLWRQLRLRPEALDLCPQNFSLIEFPRHTCRFTNDFSLLTSEIAREFPDDQEAFSRLLARIDEWDAFRPDAVWTSSREICRELGVPRHLQDFLLLPCMFYGSPDAGDMDFSQFCILFQSIFREGLARPRLGIRPLLDALLERLHETGAEISLGLGVKQILVQNGQACGVVDDHGDMWEANAVLSCAGACETAALCPDFSTKLSEAPAGQLAFVECLYQLDRAPAALGLDWSLLFASETDEFDFRPPHASIGYDSVLLCAPGNYQGCQDTPAANVLRLTRLASPDWWLGADETSYREEKQRVLEEQLGWLDARWPGLRTAVRQMSMATPRTILRFTGHVNGAIYGSHTKWRDGLTDIGNLFLIGTDQGYLGIVGAMLSGTVITNRHLLRQ